MRSLLPAVLATAAIAVRLPALAAQAPRTFGRGVPNFPFTDTETEIFNHTLSVGASMGAITHFWSTACGGRGIDYSKESGIATYRYYIDGEQEASIVFTPRMAVGMGFPPAGTSGGGGGGGGSRDDEFVIGGRGQSCDDACRGTLRHCNPVLEPDNRTGTLGDFMSRLVRYDTGAACSVDSTPWWAEDQPSYVWDPSDGNYDAYEDSTPGQEFGLRSIGSEENSPSAPVPWGTGWIGKTSDMDGYYSNVKVPFYRAIRVTAQLPPGTKPFNVYTIFRGVENVPVTVGGFELPPGALLRTHSNTNLAVPSLEFVPIVNDSSNGSGLILYHTLAFSGMPSFTYLEGCFHLLTPYTKPLVANGVSGNFPGVILSTGMEDYYDSSFYFHAGLFQLPVSGITHMCHGAGASSPPHPACPGAASGSQWSGYRFHDQDLLLYHQGAQLVVRNGDANAPTPYGSAKCSNLVMDGGPGNSTVNSLAWVYHW